MTESLNYVILRALHSLIYHIYLIIDSFPLVFTYCFLYSIEIIPKISFEFCYTILFSYEFATYQIYDTTILFAILVQELRYIIFLELKIDNNKNHNTFTSAYLILHT